MAITSSKHSRRLATGFVLLTLAVVSAAAALHGCGEADAVMLVRVEGDAAGTIAQFSVRTEVDDEVRTFAVPEQKGTINLPTSFSIQIPPQFDGAFRIEIQALNDDDEVIGEGSASANALQPTITVQLTPVTLGLPDGGPRKDAAEKPDEDASSAPDEDAGPILVDGGRPQDAGDAGKLDAPLRMDAAPKLDAGAPDTAPLRLDASDEEKMDAANEDAENDADLEP